VRSVATNEVEDQLDSLTNLPGKVQASTMTADNGVDMNPGSDRRKIANFLLVAWCVLQGSSWTIQDASAVMLGLLIGLCNRVDMARLMCSLRPARSAWLAAWPMHIRTNTRITKSGRGANFRTHDQQAVKVPSIEPCRSWPYALWIDQGLLVACHFPYI
jgi:hypothetical protein